MDILPNWHPIFVHFTVALISASVVFYFLYYVISYFIRVPRERVLELEVIARWCLWIGAVITIITFAAGLYAYNTVKHDTPSHDAMTVHRNFAIVTSIFIIFLGCFSVWLHFKRKKISLIFLIALFIMQIFLLLTAWRGGELVYRYGLGVFSLPKSEESEQSEEKNKHQHDEGKQHAHH